ncbi:MAG: T9SS type A sorting domain-containing protein, partial [bacterium]
TDIETKATINMREATNYTYANAGTHKFKVDVTWGTSDNKEKPLVFALYQNYPNPCKDRTTIQYCIPKECDVKLSLYDLSGRNVKTLVNAKTKPGRYVTTVESKNFAAGVYFLKFKAGDYKETKKIVLMK